RPRRVSPRRRGARRRRERTDRRRCGAGGSGRPEPGGERRRGRTGPAGGAALMLGVLAIVVPLAIDTLPTVSLGEAIERAARLDPAYVSALGHVDNAACARRPARPAFLLPPLEAGGGARPRHAGRRRPDRLAAGRPGGDPGRDRLRAPGRVARGGSVAAGPAGGRVRTGGRPAARYAPGARPADLARGGRAPRPARRAAVPHRARQRAGCVGATRRHPRDVPPRADALRRERAV